MKRGEIQVYDVSFAGLKLGEHHFDWKIEQKFFDWFKIKQDFTEPKLVVELSMLKSETMLEFSVQINGTICVECDLSMEPFDLQIKESSKLVVKFGEQLDCFDDEIWVIPHGQHQINLAQWFYELIVLAIPKKRVHPKVLNGQSDSEILAILNQSQPNSKEKKQENKIDPRWEALNKLR